jgi:hypothetical protein
VSLLNTTSGSRKTALPVPGFRTRYISAINAGQEYSGIPPTSDLTCQLLKGSEFRDEVPFLEIVYTAGIEI